MVATYDPKSIHINFGGTSIKDGIADGTFLTATRTAPTRSLRVGSDGGATIMVNPDRSATVEITYLAASKTNTILDEFRRVEDADPGIYPVSTLVIEDFNGESLISDDSAFIVGPPAVSYSTGEETRVWTFMLPNASINARGNNAPPRIGASSGSV